MATTWRRWFADKLSYSPYGHHRRGSHRRRESLIRQVGKFGSSRLGGHLSVERRRVTRKAFFFFRENESRRCTWLRDAAFRCLLNLACKADFEISSSSYLSPLVFSKVKGARRRAVTRALVTFEQGVLCCLTTVAPGDDDVGDVSETGGRSCIMSSANLWDTVQYRVQL